MVEASDKRSAEGAPARANATGAPARPNGWWIALLAIGLAVGAFAFLSRFGQRGDPELNHRIARLTRALWIGHDAPAAATPRQPWIVARDHADLERALTGDDAAALTAALARHRIEGVVVAHDPQAKPTSVRGRLLRLAHVRGLRGDYLTPAAGFYTPDPLQQLSPTLQQAIATVARGLLAGQRAPKVTSFPEPLRRVQNVEVMVLLRRDGRSLLWRSARGSSIARALLLAAQTARRRWMEREQALGGSIDAQLPTLEVEVALLHEDGTLGDRDHAFIDRMFGDDHGVAFERRGAWHYSLPEATRRDGHGSATRAYERLLEDNGLSPKSLQSDDLRLYRLAMTTLAISPPTETHENDPAHVTNPDEVLGTAPREPKQL